MFLYSPALHSVHSAVLSTDWVLPALQVQSLLNTAPTLEYAFCVHVVQAIFPSSDLYLPASHKVHTPPFSPVLPALQIHAVLTMDPLTENEYV